MIYGLFNNAACSSDDTCGGTIVLEKAWNKAVVAWIEMLSTHLGGQIDVRSEAVEDTWWSGRFVNVGLAEYGSCFCMLIIIIIIIIIIIDLFCFLFAKK
jgi:hypothetical protein